MTKVCIRQAIAKTPWPRWHFVNFNGPNGRESRGVVDMIAIRKNHGTPCPGTKRGDTLQIILIQIKGGGAARPTPEDRDRLRIVARRHGASKVLFALWKKGYSVKFFVLSLHAKSKQDWTEVNDLSAAFSSDIES
jgi:hypothetical protein